MKASMEDTEYFNPRSSCEERRVNAGDNVVWNGISIHAPHARSDMAYVALTLSAAYFNPRSSCEERPIEMVMGRLSKQFQSTLLMRGATPAFR